MAEYGKPVIVEAVPMQGNLKIHTPGPSGDSPVDENGIPKGYVVIMVPAELAYNLVSEGKGIACKVESLRVEKK